MFSSVSFAMQRRVAPELQADKRKEGGLGKKKGRYIDEPRLERKRPDARGPH